MKDDGILYIAIPNGFGWFELQNLLPRFLCKTSWGLQIVRRMSGIKDTINIESQHVNFFMMYGAKHLLKRCGWQVVRQVNDEFLGGIVFDRILARLPSLAKWNVEVADKLPSWMADGWIFVCKKAE